jgi:hypothetical protein
MRIITKKYPILAILSFGSIIALAQPALAIDAELAKKCRELAIKAHPRAMPGSKTGTAQAQREFFQECISKKGDVKVDEQK